MALPLSNIKCKYLLTFSILFSFFHFFTQNVSKKDSLTIERLCKNAKDSLSLNPVSAFQIGDSVILISKKNNYSIGLIRGYNVLGSIRQREAKYAQALSYFEKAIEIARTCNCDNDLSMVLYNISGLYSTMSNYDRSFEASTEALNIKIQIKDSLGIARCYRQIAECLFTKGDSKAGLLYMNKAVDLIRKLNRSKPLVRILISRAIIFIDEKKFQPALNDLYEARSITDSNSDAPSLSSIYLHLGLCFDNMHKTDSAVNYYSRSLLIARQLNEKLVKTVCLNNLGEIYLKRKNIPFAENYLLEGLPIAKEINSIVDIRNFYGNLAELYFIKGDYQMAYLYEQQFEAYSDSLMNEQKMKAIEELSIKFETREITEQNKLLQTQSKLDRIKVEQKNYVIYAILIFIFLAAMIVTLFIKKRQEKNQHKNNELKQKLLLSQMNPHFIFNSVDNIQSLIYNDKNKEAINYLTKFSKLTRQILENSNENYITLSEEFAMLDNYLNIQQLLYSNKFVYTVNFSESIDQENILIPPMLTQPFIENAIKHGLKNKTNGGIVNIRFCMENNNLLFEVTDNGSGLESNIDHNHRSLATQIVAERLNTTTNKKNIKIFTSNIILDNVICGVKTSFEIPYIYNN
ncbi:MAG: tetratricopeptide repeat protein [Bacteroidetes bacterium]|nr:tetratricopeptide repeat protein [Bacteroidota bacterium]